MSWRDWHTKPVARSLSILDGLGVLEYVEGQTIERIGPPFTVTIRRTEFTPGIPGEAPATRATFLVCERRELHAVAKEACRLAHLAKGRK